MDRKQFLKDILLGAAMCLVPKILQPIAPEILEEVEVEIGYCIYGVSYVTGNATYEFIKQETGSLYLPKESADILRQYTPPQIELNSNYLNHIKRQQVRANIRV